jgi:hypothetical protein
MAMSPKQNKETSDLRRLVRQAVADYMRSEGCYCCQDRTAHRQHEAKLAKLLHVPMYGDKSGYNFGKFESKPN